jgi:cell division protein FtsB
VNNTGFTFSIGVLIGAINQDIANRCNFIIQILHMQRLKRIVTNKYILAGTFFLVWMLFFDQRDIFQQLDRKKDLNQLEAKKVFYQKEIEKSRKELSDLQSNPAAIEKFARERFLMKKEGEDIFILDDSAVIKNN